MQIHRRYNAFIAVIAILIIAIASHHLYSVATNKAGHVAKVASETSLMSCSPIYTFTMAPGVLKYGVQASGPQIIIEGQPVKASSGLRAANKLTTEETKLFDLVNQDRKANNIGPLQIDSDLTELARKHSMDMYNRKYFRTLP